jgi:hypothetical protein
MQQFISNFRTQQEVEKNNANIETNMKIREHLRDTDSLKQSPEELLSKLEKDM